MDTRVVLCPHMNTSQSAQPVWRGSTPLTHSMKLNLHDGTRSMVASNLRTSFASLRNLAISKTILAGAVILGVIVLVFTLALVTVTGVRYLLS
jgi:hypothetical protein